MKIINVWNAKKIKTIPLKPLNLTGKPIKGTPVKYNMLKPLKLFKDTDKDKVADFFDCEPNNPKKQGLIHEGNDTQQPKIPEQKMFDELKEMGEQIASEKSGLSDGEGNYTNLDLPYVEGHPNWHIAYKELKDYIEKRKFAENIRKGLKIKPESKKLVRWYARGPPNFPIRGISKTKPIPRTIRQKQWIEDTPEKLERLKRWRGVGVIRPRPMFKPIFVGWRRRY